MPTLTISKEVQQKPVEWLKVGSDTMKYLHDNNCVTVYDAIVLLNDMPTEYQLEIKLCLISGI